MTPAMDYAAAWDFLDQLQLFKIKLGLESMEAFLADLGQPQRLFPAVHIAGTNGKGSTAAFLVAILRQAGWRVGLYSSPHLESVRERFQVDGGIISRADFAREATRIKAVLAGRQITYFEFTTALAFLWFAAKKVDVAVVETGLGGRLDATNVLVPLVSVITNVSADHEQHLGQSLAAIAAEKAGIVKDGVPVVSGVDGDQILAVLSDTCAARQAALFVLGRDFHVWNEDAAAGWSYEGLRHAGQKPRLLFPALTTSLAGRHQHGNAALALATAELLCGQGFDISPRHMRAGIALAHWPGRLESFVLTHAGGEKRILLDGAHNPAGALALAQALRGFPRRRLILVWAAMADKDLSGTLLPVATAAAAIHFGALPHERAARPEALALLLPAPLRSRTSCHDTVEQALDAACADADALDLILVAGSLYLVGSVRSHLTQAGTLPPPPLPPAPVGPSGR